MERITEDEAKHYLKLDPKKDFLNSMKRAVAYTLTKDDKWDVVTYYGESWEDPTDNVTRPHYVYILVNPGVPGVCKIGYTRTTIYERCRQINSATGVIEPWYPVYSIKCPSGPLLEGEVHKHLEAQGFRVNDKREGFHISVKDSINVIELFAKKYNNIPEKSLHLQSNDNINDNSY